MGVVAEATDFRIMFLACGSVFRIGMLLTMTLLRNRR